MLSTIGFFDGVHRGHQFVIQQVAAEARKRGLEAVVITFDRPPREVVTGKTCPLLTTLDDKKRLILEAGADRCEVLPFTPDLAALSAKDFMREILKEQLKTEVLMLGYDNRFGHRSPDNHEGFDDYRRYGQELGIEVLQMPELKMGDSPINHQNSTFLRRALSEGDVATAAELLGRHYAISGRIVHGRGEGRRLTFPTANLSPETVKTIIPAAGVYAVRVSGEGEADGKRGMMNIGTRPTYHGTTLSIEVHLFDFDGDLYDQMLTVEFLRRIRDERTFDSPEALRKQLENDRLFVETIFEE